MLTDLLIDQGELEHRRVKRFFAHTNKNRFTWQITKQERRQHILRNASNRFQYLKTHIEEPCHHEIAIPMLTTNSKLNSYSSSTRTQLHKSPSLFPTVPFEMEEIVPLSSPKEHHFISETRKFPLTLIPWLSENADDPALKVGFD